MLICSCRGTKQLSALLCLSLEMQQDSSGVHGQPASTVCHVGVLTARVWCHDGMKVALPLAVAAISAADRLLLECCRLV